MPSFSGDGGRLNLPDACAPTKYCGSAPHTYRADPEQVRRIAGQRASGAVTKVAASVKGKAVRACVPRDPDAEVVIVAAAHDSAGAWLLEGNRQQERTDGNADRGRGRGLGGNSSSGGGGGSGSKQSVYVRDDMELFADIVYDKLESGAHMHCCSSKDFLEPEVISLLEREAQFRGESQAEARRKVAAWKANGQWHTECMCARAAEMQAAEAEKEASP